MPRTVSMQNLWLESSSLLFYCMDAVPSCPLNSYPVDQYSAQTSFKKFIQQMEVNAETHKWSICPKWNIYILRVFPKALRPSQKGGGKILRDKGQGRPEQKCYIQELIAAVYNIKPVSILAQYGRGFMSPQHCLSARTVGDRFQKRQSQMFLAGWAVSSRWPHNQVYGEHKLNRMRCKKTNKQNHTIKGHYITSLKKFQQT